MSLSPGEPLFDAKRYLEEYPEVARFGLDPWVHYLERGGFEWRNPNPLFDSGWYRSQLPEADRPQNPLCHYLFEGAFQGLDPHPLFDSACFLRALGESPLSTSPLETFLRLNAETWSGVYRSLGVLDRVQNDFLRKVEVTLLEDRRGSSRRWGVFLQCGARSLHPRWLTQDPKPFDLIVNHYDDSFREPLAADLRFCQNLGTKCSGFHLILEKFPGLLERYDHLLLLDDDLRVSETAITRLFEWVETLGLDLAQAAVAPGSYGTWPCLFEVQGSIGRYLNAVEIMMPVLSRRALTVTRHLFPRSISGWGLDFALGEAVRRHFGPRSVGVIDAIAFSHENPIDPEEGAYYRMLRDHGLSALVEERAMALRYGAKGPIDGIREETGAEETCDPSGSGPKVAGPFVDTPISP